MREMMPREEDRKENFPANRGLSTEFPDEKPGIGDE
jgi:hypothetical protein